VWAYQYNGVKTTNGGGPIIYTGINNTSSNISKEYKLYQNYPNPFNPSTTIRYSIPSVSSPRIDPLSSPRILGGDPVTLKVYDVTGREIETLVNVKQSPGTYEVTFDGGSYASGVYFYRLTSNSFSETKKMLYLK
ncbi:T9SS C-terminal target domain-containing protein, partial [bacterium]